MKWSAGSGFQQFGRAKYQLRAGHMEPEAG